MVELCLIYALKVVVQYKDQTTFLSSTYRLQIVEVFGHLQSVVLSHLKDIFYHANA